MNFYAPPPFPPFHSRFQDIFSRIGVIKYFYNNARLLFVFGLKTNTQRHLFIPASPVCICLRYFIHFLFHIKRAPVKTSSRKQKYIKILVRAYACITPSTFIHLLNTMHSFDFEKSRCDNTIFRVSANTLFTFHSSFFILYFFMKLTDSRSLQRSPLAYPTLFQFFIFPMQKGGGGGEWDRKQIQYHYYYTFITPGAYMAQKNLSCNFHVLTKKRKLKNPFVCFNIIPLWCKYLWIFPFFSPHKGDLEPALFAYETRAFNTEIAAQATSPSNFTSRFIFFMQGSSNDCNSLR